jgi:hypothetical protein
MTQRQVNMSVSYHRKLEMSYTDPIKNPKFGKIEKQKYHDRTRSHFHTDLRDDLYILLFTVLKILNERIQLRNKFK